MLRYAVWLLCSVHSLLCVGLAVAQLGLAPCCSLCSVGRKGPCGSLCTGRVGMDGVKLTEQKGAVLAARGQQGGSRELWNH